MQGSAMASPPISQPATHIRGRADSGPSHTELQGARSTPRSMIECAASSAATTIHASTLTSTPSRSNTAASIGAARTEATNHTMNAMPANAASRHGARSAPLGRYSSERAVNP